MTQACKILPVSEDKKLQIEGLLDRMFGPGRRVRMAERLRENSTEVKNLCYMALDKNETVIAAISYWAIAIGNQEGLLLGPLVVDATYQGQGVGRTLIQHTIALAEQADYAYILLVGDLSYYQSSGFERVPEGLLFTVPVDVQRVLIRKLKQGCPLVGVVRGCAIGKRGV